jgi:hypothetical protein
MTTHDVMAEQPKEMAASRRKVRMAREPNMQREYVNQRGVLSDPTNYNSCQRDTEL